MKSASALAMIVAAAIILSGCYWVAPGTPSGGISFSASVPRDVLPPAYTGYALRVYLYDSPAVSALYSTSTMVSPSSPVPTGRGDDVAVTATASPIPIDGHDYYEVEPAPTDQAGALTIPDIAATRKYRLHLQYIYLDPANGNNVNFEGVSAEFEVIAGVTVDQAVDLYWQWVPMAW